MGEKLGEKWGEKLGEKLGENQLEIIEKIINDSQISIVELT
ncbi:hypothetical protein RSJ42_11695 [Methanosarcina hadiensis]